jgi:hypothetical protein
MGHVYFIDNDSGLTKIGRTKKNPEKRLKELQQPNLTLRFFFQTKFESKLEVALHTRYRRNLIGREWFDLNDYTTDELKTSCEKINEGIECIFSKSDDLHFLSGI